MSTIKPTQKVVFINNKGGVGKTTLAYNTACKLSEKGSKVLLVDADPQCNLTLLALGAFKYEELGFFDNHTIYNVVKPLFSLGGDVDMSIVPTPIGYDDRLHILPGNLLFADFDDVLASGFNEMVQPALASRGFKVTSGLNRYIEQVAMKYGYDAVIIDVSPSLTGSLNKAILFGTDFFITVTNPDLFSEQGIMNLGMKLVNWKKEQQERINLAKRSSIPASDVLDGQTTFLGYVVNSHNVYKKKPIEDHEKRMLVIKQKIKDYLSIELSRNGLTELTYTKELGITQDYGRITAIGQDRNKPLFEVTEEELNKREGSVNLLEKCQKEMEALAQEVVFRLEKWGV